eukprot:347832-Chlamydomonas_euryale.AAC.1
MPASPQRQQAHALISVCPDRHDQAHVCMGALLFSPHTCFTNDHCHLNAPAKNECSDGVRVYGSLPPVPSLLKASIQDGRTHI